MRTMRKVKELSIEKNEETREGVSGYEKRQREIKETKVQIVTEERIISKESLTWGQRKE